MAIKLDDVLCLGRVNGMHEQDPRGSYVAFECIEKGNPEDEPQKLVFVVSEYIAQNFAADLHKAAWS